MSHHTITGVYMAPDETEIEVEIKFGFSPGCPERGPAYAHGGIPADPAEVELLSVAFAGSEDAGLKSQVEAWAVEYLQDGGYADALEQAEADRAGPDPDDERDRLRDEEMTDPINWRPHTRSRAA